MKSANSILAILLLIAGTLLSCAGTKGTNEVPRTRGRIYSDEAKIPLSNAVIRLVKISGSGNQITLDSLSSDQYGSFYPGIAQYPSDDIFLWATHSTGFDTVLVPYKEFLSDSTIYLPKNMTKLVGEVLDSLSNNPIADAVITVNPSINRAIVTLSDGSFIIRDTKMDRYDYILLTVDAWGYKSGSVTLENPEFIPRRTNILSAIKLLKDEDLEGQNMPADYRERIREKRGVGFISRGD